MKGLPDLDDVRLSLVGVGRRDSAAVANALISGAIASDTDAYGIRAATSVSSSAAAVFERALRMTTTIAEAPDAGRWLLVGLLSRQGVEPAQPRLVWTAPGAKAGARGTAPVIREQIRRATRSITVVGYAVTVAADPLLADLADAARRRVSVTIVADRLDEKLPTILRAWPDDLAPPELWTRREDPTDPKSAMHAKVVVFDNRYLLITSANLTFHGLHGNLELGVLLEGKVASDMTNLLRRWIANGLITRPS